MANEEHLRILKQGVKAWNAWREQNPEVSPDLSESNLSHAKLSQVDLSFVDLSGADLRLANLELAILGNVDLSRANLSGARLIQAHLSDADLALANLIAADLSNAHLGGARLGSANLSSAQLIGADLSQADLGGVDLRGADLRGADFTDCRVVHTVFANVDLSHARGLDTLHHHGPSSIGIDTVYLSGGNIPDVFLRGAGVPENFIEYVHSLVGQPLQFHSCFISFSHHDQRFCERLRADLQARGVRVWFFPEDATWGKTVWGEIDRGIRVYDKLVVVCSKNSLQSGPVLREIERGLQREDREGRQVLFPVRLDDYIFEKWQHERKADVIVKVVGDFTGWDKDAAKYEASFQKLMRALQSETDTGVGQKAP